MSAAQQEEEEEEEKATCCIVEGANDASSVAVEEGTCSWAFSGQAPSVGTQPPAHPRQCHRPISAMSASGPPLRLLLHQAAKARPC